MLTYNKATCLFTLSLTLILIVTPIGLYAQFGDFDLTENLNAEKVSAKGYINLDKVQPGSQFQIAIVVDIAKGWHINAYPAGDLLSPTEIVLPQASNISFGEVSYPTGDSLEIASVGEVSVYHDTIAIGIPATLSQDAPIEQMTLDFVLNYQACSDEQCLLPETLDISVPINVVSIEETVQLINDDIFSGITFAMTSDVADNDNSQGGIAGALSGGKLWLAFLLIFVGGVVTSLTPCVYPLIPITVSVFGAGESTGIFRSFLLSLVYVFGIVVTYSILGVVVASTGALFGGVMSNPYVIGFISVILVTLGLSMFGVFEIQLPSSVQNRLNTVGGAGFFGAFGMGTVAGVIAAPCTGPALAAVLTYIAKEDISVFLSFWLMFTYAFGMGLLFICIGTFSGFLSALPRSGGWMYVLENIFGIVIITMALYFLKDLAVFEPIKNLLQKSIPFLLILTGLWMCKLTEGFKGISSKMQVRKACGLLLAIVGAFMIIGGPQQPVAGPPVAGSHLNWVYDEPTALETAVNEDKLVMLDFYATWCGACNELDHKTFSDQRVVDRLEGYVTVKIDFSAKVDKTLKEKYNVPGLPVVIFMDGQGNIYERIEKFVKPEKMLEIIDSVERKAYTDKD